jgi:hypothetical protein
MTRFRALADLTIAKRQIREGHFTVANRRRRHQHDRTEAINPWVAIQELEASLETWYRTLKLLPLDQRDICTMISRNQNP